MKIASLLVGVSLCLTAGAAMAADFNDSSYGSSFISEVRMGVMSHDYNWREKDTIDVQAELLFRPLAYLSQDASFWEHFAAPHPHVGVSLNTDGKTSYLYGGLTWLLPVYGPLFLEGTFGAGLHNGNLENEDMDREPLGTRVLFRESASVGLEFNRFRVMATIEHLSNAGADRWNHGLTNIGGKVAYKF